MTKGIISNEQCQLVKAHKINVYQSYYMSEQGEGYSWEPWGSDTDQLKATDTTVLLSIPASAQISESNGGETLMYWQGRGYTAQEAVDCHLAVEHWPSA